MTTGRHKRPHTPITTEAQRGMMGAELRRRREGKRKRMPGITEEELSKHLKEAKGKDLPERAKRGKARAHAARKKRRGF